MNTRLVWVILFAVAVGLLVLFSLRSVQSGTTVSRLVAQTAAAQESLARKYPESSLSLLRTIQPAPGVTNLVVDVRPPKTDSTPIATFLADVELVVRQNLDLNQFDTLLLCVAGQVVRIMPARAGPAR